MSIEIPERIKEIAEKYKIGESTVEENDFFISWLLELGAKIPNLEDFLIANFGFDRKTIKRIERTLQEHISTTKISKRVSDITMRRILEILTDYNEQHLVDGLNLWVWISSKAPEIKTIKGYYGDKGVLLDKFVKDAVEFKLKYGDEIEALRQENEVLRAIVKGLYEWSKPDRIIIELFKSYTKFQESVLKFEAYGIKVPQAIKISVDNVFYDTLERYVPYVREKWGIKI